jgi:hypothetical protein
VAEQAAGRFWSAVPEGCDLPGAPEKQRFSWPEAALDVWSVPELWLLLIPETDAIFVNVRAAHERSSADPECLRISLDTKAKVKIGDFSRGGSGRSAEPVKALDHAMSPEAILVPAGILEVATKQLSIVFGTSRGTSDFMADCLDLWCRIAAERMQRFVVCRSIWTTSPRLRAAELSSWNVWSSSAIARDWKWKWNWSTFLRSTANTNLIERCWGILEQHWNGTLLSTIETALSCAATMTWKGIRPLIHLLDDVYERGGKLSEIEFRPFAARLLRSEKFWKWSLTIKPN